MTAPLRSILPPVYGTILPGIFDRAAVIETRATCDNCAMCDRGDASALVTMQFFRPDLKCCTFNPHLPNYLVGAILSDPELEEGKKRIRAKIADRYGATPRWLGPPRRLAAIQNAARKSGHFGKSEALVCPFLDREKGLCTVWAHREGVCSTYFCKYTKGQKGTAFWRALKEYLGHIEDTLSRYAVYRLDPSMKEPHVTRTELTLEDLEGKPPSEADWKTWWGKWVGREEAFYVASYELVKNMTRSELDAIRKVLPNDRERLHKLVSAYEALQTDVLPAHLIVNPKMRTWRAGDAVVVTSYNPYDSFSVDKDLFEVLELLRADETVEQNLARLERDHEIGLAPELVQELYTHGVLAVPGEGNDE